MNEMLVEQSRQLAAEGHAPQAVDEIVSFRSTISPEMDFTKAASATRRLAKFRGRGSRSGTKVRVAVLGSTTTTQLTSFLDLFLFAQSVDAEIYEAPYGLLRQEILDPGSQLYQFAPQFVFLATTRRDLGALPAISASAEAVDAAVEGATSEWIALWQALHDRLSCQIIQNNFDAPPWRVFGNLETTHGGAPGSFIEKVNARLARSTPKWVSMYDLDGLAASVGRWNWGDERFFHLAKLPCAPEHLVPYAHGIAALVLARMGRSRKCLVLDLDNTLWGGVIGDDGLAGIALGQGDGLGEAYVAFQHYVRALRERGVILAVCSKNEEANAKEPFEKHPEMVLRLDDISCFVANWEDKAANLRRIARELNIGLDSLVFADDNPAERSLVRRLLPEVAVPEMPADPADYVRAVDRHRYFEVAALSNEDFQRTEYYRANVQRQQIASSAGDIDSFLGSLEMRGWIGTIGEMELDRSVQLIGKSNQFNLTTRRHGSADIQRMMASPDWVLRVVKLVDRFGDNGLISVLAAQRQGDALVIDTWLMSCRVLKRGVEQFLLNHLAEAARARGLRRLIGEYIPTSKNVLVKNHFRDLGFTEIESFEDGRTRWQLMLDDTFQPSRHHIAGDVCEPAA